MCTYIHRYAFTTKEVYFSKFLLFFIPSVFFFKTLICCFTYLCIHWLLLVCALARVWTHNLGVLGWHSNQLSYPAKGLSESYFLCHWNKGISAICTCTWHDSRGKIFGYKVPFMSVKHEGLISFACFVDLILRRAYSQELLKCTDSLIQSL